MKVVTTFHAPSSVVSSVKCCLGSRDTEHLAVAKHNRLDVYSLQPSGLQHECGIDLLGKISCVRAIPIPDTERSKLAVLLAHPDPEVLFFSFEEFVSGQKRLVVNHTLPLRERGTRPAEFFNDLFVHPRGEVAVVHCFMGRIKVLQLKAGDYEKDFDVALPEFNVFSICFPLTDEGYPLAILHQDALRRIQLVSRDLERTRDGWDLSPFPSTVIQATAISDKILPFPEENIPFLIPLPYTEPEDEEEDEESSFLGGILVVGGTKILLYELASEKSRKKQEGKRNRLEKMKVSDAKSAKAKKAERDARRRKPVASVEWPWGEVTAWTGVERDPYDHTRFFIGDCFGNLALLSTDSIKDVGLVLVPLGVASPATTLAYLSNQAIFLGSHLGDSQLITISSYPSSDEGVPPIPVKVTTVDKTALASLSRRKGKQRALDDMDVDEEADQDPVPGKQGYVITPDGSYVKVVQSFKNIGPIIDATMVDVDGSGQQQLVTCSGGSNTGSLNVVRNGSEFQELCSISGLPDLTGVWTMKPNFENNRPPSCYTLIVVSTLSETLLYRLDDKGHQSSFTQVNHAGGLITNERTLAFANIARRTVETNKLKYADSNYAVQVVPSGIYLLEYDVNQDTYNPAGQYLPSDVKIPPTIQARPTEVTAASINAGQIAVAFNKGVIEVLVAHENMTGFFTYATRAEPLAPEISAISCLPARSETPTTAQLVVSYWSTNRVEVIYIRRKRNSSLGDLERQTLSDPLPALVRSVQFFEFQPNEKYLICGLADGSFAHFRWKSDARELVDKKVVSLGNAPVHLSVCEVDGKKAIFAAGSRATAIVLDKQKLSHSPVMLKDVTAACRINSDSFPDSLVFAHPHGLTIGKVRELNKLNIRTIPLAYVNPRRIEYVPVLGAFAVASNICRPSRVGDYEPIESDLRLYDANSSTFELLTQFKPEIGEEFSALVSFVRKEGDKDVPYICTGSVVWPEDGNKPVTGRVRVFTPVSLNGKDTRRELSLVTSQDAVGPVYALKWVGDKLVAAVESAVFLYECVPDPSTPSSFNLEVVSNWNNIYVPKSLGTFNDHIVTGDLVYSVAIIKVKEGKFISEARDYGAIQPVAVEALAEDRLITGTGTMDLFTYALGERDERKVLERDGGYHLADFVTKIIRGSLSSDSANGSPLSPEVIFCTSMGAIGIIVDIKDQKLSLDLSSLQRNLTHVAPAAGGESHAKFRAPRTSNYRINDSENGAFGFLDGDFLESFLNIIGEERKVEKVYAGSSEPERLTLPVEEYRRTLEALQALH